MSPSGAEPGPEGRWGEQHKGKMETIKIQFYMICPKCKKRFYGSILEDRWIEFPIICIECDVKLMLELNQGEKKNPNES
jgi:hydrogenase maturation factor HypF (carbamoyltransferase family)